ncbi:hypothetical protein B0O99DRAFT_629499 [Bisporella sp. PMI_857]|nr:hypothetical protein B0O99DRAFT_629499 [Bisporella sp. PMI_857]
MTKQQRKKHIRNNSVSIRLVPIARPAVDIIPKYKATNSKARNLISSHLYLLPPSLPAHLSLFTPPLQQPKPSDTGTNTDKHAHPQTQTLPPAQTRRIVRLCDGKPGYLYPRLYFFLYVNADMQVRNSLQTCIHSQASLAAYRRLSSWSGGFEIEAEAEERSWRARHTTAPHHLFRYQPPPQSRPQSRLCISISAPEHVSSVSVLLSGDLGVRLLSPERRGDALMVWMWKVVRQLRMLMVIGKRVCACFCFCLCFWMCFWVCRRRGWSRCLQTCWEL